MDWFKIWKEYIKAVYCHSCLFNFFAEYIMGIAQLDKSQAENKITKRNVNNLRYADDTTLIAESEEELKGPLIGVKEESEKADLKLNIQKAKIMASSPLNSWQRDGKKIGNSDRFYFLGLQNYCEQWLQPQNWKMLAPWKKSYDKTLLLFFSD